MNEGDIANDSHDKMRSIILSNRVTFEGESETHCEECGEEIPEKRRKLGGVKMCVDCKEISDKNSSHYNKRH